MIPKLGDINIGQEIEIVEEPTYTHKIDFENKRVVKYTDGIEAVKQAIYLILNTERYNYEIYDWSYGVELADLIGKDKAYVYSELKRRIREALLRDNRIKGVDNFIFESTERNIVHARFTVHTTFGNIDIERQVNI